MKTINDLIKLYQIRIRNIRLEVVKLESEIETLQYVIMDLEEIVEENKKQVADYVVKNNQLGLRDKRKGLDKETISEIEKQAKPKFE